MQNVESTFPISYLIVIQSQERSIIIKGFKHKNSGTVAKLKG